MKTILLLITLLMGTNVFSQEFLDIKKHAHCELFARKIDFKTDERLQTIDSLKGQLVTVFFLKGEKNQVEKSYTGKVMEINNKEINKNGTMLLVEVEKGDGIKGINFPLTNDKSFRIYLTACFFQE